MNRLTQSALLTRLRDELGIHLAAKTLRTFDLRAAMVPAGKKPRYNWDKAKAIILGEFASSPELIDALDSQFKRRMRAPQRAS